MGTTNNTKVIYNCCDRIQNIYQRFIPFLIKENQRLEFSISADKLYKDTQIEFGDRMLSVRWLKIPTFQRNKKQYYYVIFFGVISLWRKGEIREIKKQILETCDLVNVDSYTIFQIGRFHGRFDLNENIKFHNMFIFNTTEFTETYENRFYKLLMNFLQTRVDNIKKNYVFGTIEADVKRIEKFIDMINNIYTNISSKNVISSSINTSTNIISNRRN